MIKRFFEIKLHLERVDALASLVLSFVEVRELQTSFQHMTKFNQVTVALQRQGTTSLQVREIFDHVLEDYPDFKKYLAINAHIVHDKLFELAVMKVTKGEELNAEESKKVAKLRKTHAVPADGMSNVPLKNILKFRWCRCFFRTPTKLCRFDSEENETAQACCQVHQ